MNKLGEKAEIQARIETLEAQLHDARVELEKLDGERAPLQSTQSISEKKGYLFKWADRSIGWGGSKWGLRYVVLKNGRLSYYGSHQEATPRYGVLLRGLAVRDDGWKRNRRHVSKTPGEDPPLDEPGAYFFVFSIYERPDTSSQSITLDNTDIVPLLRFSTPSLADKARWISSISETCSYCETDMFLKDEALRAAEMTKRQEEEKIMANAMPESRDETLPPLYFAPAPPRPKALQKRMPSVPSFTKQLDHANEPNKHLPRVQSFQSKTKDGDFDKVEARSKRSYPASKPMHREAACSLLSPDAKTQNFRGFLNLGFLILLVSNFRLLLETIRNHGFALSFSLPTMGDFSHDPWQHFPFITAFLVQLGFVALAFAIEWMLGSGRLDEYLGMTLHYMNAHTALGSSCVVVWTAIDQPVTGFVLLFYAIITWMKLISYVQANEDYRLTRGQNEDPAHTPRRLVEDLDPHEMHLAYPENVTLRNILYFWCAPTLTYQMAFPKFPRVRWWKVLTIVSRMIAVIMVSSFLVAQVVNPTLRGLLRDLEDTGGKFSIHILFKYWLQLSITRYAGSIDDSECTSALFSRFLCSTYLWLLMFYGYFHLYLNLCAELLRFGDRIFYRDWWNSATASAFWYGTQCQTSADYLSQFFCHFSPLCVLF